MCMNNNTIGQYPVWHIFAITLMVLELLLSCNIVLRMLHRIKKWYKDVCLTMCSLQNTCSCTTLLVGSCSLLHSPVEIIVYKTVGQYLIWHIFTIRLVMLQLMYDIVLRMLHWTNIWYKDVCLTTYNFQNTCSCTTLFVYSYSLLNSPVEIIVYRYIRQVWQVD